MITLIEFLRFEWNCEIVINVVQVAYNKIYRNVNRFIKKIPNLTYLSINGIIGLFLKGGTKIYEDRW